MVKKNLGKYEGATRESQETSTHVCVLYAESLLLKFVVFVVILQSPRIIAAVAKYLADLIPTGVDTTVLSDTASVCPQSANGVSLIDEEIELEPSE